VPNTLSQPLSPQFGLASLTTSQSNSASKTSIKKLAASYTLGTTIPT